MARRLQTAPSWWLRKHYLEAWLFWLGIYGLRVVIFAWTGVYLTAEMSMDNFEREIVAKWIKHDHYRK